MTRKDYVLIAAALLAARNEKPFGGDVPTDRAYEQGRRDGILAAANFIADSLQEANPQFNMGKFMKAAGWLQ